MNWLDIAICVVAAMLLVGNLAFLWVVLAFWRSVSPQPPSSYTCRSGACVEGDLDLDDGRPTDPGEELTVVSDTGWEEETLVSAGEGGKR